MQLSEHFALHEFVDSIKAHENGIDNTPTAAIIATLGDTANRMENVRQLLGNVAIHVNSGYRCPALNKVVGGVPDSAHLTGHAVDFIAPDFGNPEAIVDQLKQFNFEYDQIIVESKAWVHISFDPRFRRRTLSGELIDGEMHYQAH